VLSCARRAVRASVRSRIATAARWLAPSGACACAGALAGGAVEGIDPGGAWPAAVAIGGFALAAAPALLVGSAVVRGLYALWQPDALVASLVEDGGGAPRLAGWVGFVGLAALALAWAMFQGTWLLAWGTAFKPLTLGYAMPALAIGAALALAAVSGPVARLLAAIARGIDRRWRRGGRRTLLRPRVVLGGAAAVALATIYALWRIVARPRIGPLDTALLYAPAAALVTTVAAHALWSRARRRTRAIAGGAAAALAVGAMAAAAVATRADPSLTLEIWSARPLTGLAIERIFDLDAIHHELPAEALEPAARPGAAHPDLVLITIGAVRAERTPPYGGFADMPVLRELAGRGTLLDRAYAPSNVTRRAIPSMMTGLQPNRVRGRVAGPALRIDPRHVLVAERLRAGGYDTAGFLCCRDVWGPEARTGLARGLDHVEREADGPRLASLLRAWLDARERQPGRRPLFLWMHVEPSDEPGVPEGLTEPAPRTWDDRSLARADALMATVLGAFSGRPADRAPIAIVTADHGDGFGERGAPLHAGELDNALLHVPLVLAGPGIRIQRVSEAVSLTDLAPTLLELAGFVPPERPTFDGRSFADLAQGRRAGGTGTGVAFAAAIEDRAGAGADGATAVIRGTWKLIDGAAGLELYDLRTDFAERVNVIGQHRAIAAEVEQLLRERQALGQLPPPR
jgi:hypothetical protein